MSGARTRWVRAGPAAASVRARAERRPPSPASGWGVSVGQKVGGAGQGGGWEAERQATSVITSFSRRRSGLVGCPPTRDGRLNANAVHFTCLPPSNISPGRAFLCSWGKNGPCWTHRPGGRAELLATEGDNKTQIGQVSVTLLEWSYSEETWKVCGV